MENERNFEVRRFKIHDTANLSTETDLRPIANLLRSNIDLPDIRSGRNVVEEKSATDH